MGIELPKDNCKYCFFAPDSLAMRICHEVKAAFTFYYFK